MSELEGALVDLTGDIEHCNTCGETIRDGDDYKPRFGFTGCGCVSFHFLSVCSRRFHSNAIVGRL